MSLAATTRLVIASAAIAVICTGAAIVVASDSGDGPTPAISHVTPRPTP